MDQQTENVEAPQGVAADKKRRVDMAKLAEQAERYDDMVENMKAVAQMNIPLSSEERNLLSVAYKNVVGTRRSSWRIIFSIHQKEKDALQKIAKEYLDKISDEIKTTCTEVVKLIDDFLIKEDAETVEHESETFYLKMKGDYYRYVAEVQEGEDKKDFAGKAADAYNEAKEKCKDMASAHPIKLGLALNHSVFFYEIQGLHDEACKIAKKAFDEAISAMDELPSHTYKDSSLIMQLLRDNLTLWSSAEADEEDEASGEVEQEAAE